MSHKCIRLLIEDTAKTLADDIQFTYARTSDFNQIKDKNYPFITLDPLTVTPQYATDGTLNYMKAWSCNMAFYELDQKGSTGDEYALILDRVDGYVDKFINRLNTYMGQSSQEIVISGITQTSFVKATADVLTGFLLTFTILAQDDFDYCSVSDEC